MAKGTDLAGKVALITGAGRNIGRAIALELAAGGAAVAINTRKSREDAEKVAQEVRAAGGQAEVFMADIVDVDAVNKMVEGIVKRFGKVDILVLNASVRKETPFMENFEEWKSSSPSRWTARSIALGVPAAHDQGGRRCRDAGRRERAVRFTEARARPDRRYTGSA
jgi:NAD(P)-dependent dehydrogenase (short-subunit alcohol dehydrogenase family)